MAMRSFLIIALSLQGFQSLQTNKLTETAKFPLRLHNSSRIIYSDNINRETGTVKPEYKVLAAESPYNFQPTDSGTKSISSSSDRKPKHLFPFWSGYRHSPYARLPLGYRFPYLPLRQHENGVPTYRVAPFFKHNAVNKIGEADKAENNKLMHDKMENQGKFELTSQSRVIDTLNVPVHSKEDIVHLNPQDDVGKHHSNTTSEDTKATVLEEEILGRANYFAHRLNIDAQTPLNNAIDNNDFAIIPGARRNNSEISFRPPLNPQDCCLFVFLDGSAFYLDDFLEKLTGFYRLMYGTVNAHPHYVSRNCRSPEIYGASCTYIWYSGYGWVVGVGRYIGQTKGVIYTKKESICPTSLDGWRYLNQDLQWKDNGDISVTCAS